MNIGFFGLLGLLFIGLKLGGVIDWSWWLVLLPIYGGVAFMLIVMAFFGLIGAGAFGISALLDRRRGYRRFRS